MSVNTVLQEICKDFLQGLQDNALNHGIYLASLGLKIKLFLQDISKKNCKVIFLQDLFKMLQKIIL